METMSLSEGVKEGLKVYQLQQNAVIKFKSEIEVDLVDKRRNIGVNLFDYIGGCELAKENVKEYLSAPIEK